MAATEFTGLASFDEGLGRMTYVAGALEIERLFLEPLYRFFSPHPCTSTRRVPLCVRSFLNNLAVQVSRCRHFTCSQSAAPRYGAVLDKLITTKFPAWAILVNMAADMKRMNMWPSNGHHGRRTGKQTLWPTATSLF